MKTKSKKRKSPLKAKAKTRKTGRTAAIKKASDQNDIFEIILKHHKPLKPLFKTMKNPKATLSQLQHAFEEFAPLLIMHSRPEEKALYAPMKERKSDIRTEGFEGETEHHIADQLIAEIR
ncbi:MAG: hemerythrin domain-containing protein, partial [Bdellovibrionota bacterium]